MADPEEPPQFTGNHIEKTSLSKDIRLLVIDDLEICFKDILMLFILAT